MNTETVRRRLQKLLTVLCVGLLGGTGMGAASGPTATPTLTPLPVTTTSTPFGAAVGLAEMNYLEDEYIVSGTANIYGYDAAKQIVLVTPGLPYAARLIVRRPGDPRKFNGTILFEPFNSTPGHDLDFHWLYNREKLMREGYIYVGLANTFETNAFARAWNPARYGGLNVITFGQSWDMIAQLLVLLKDATNSTNPLAGYNPRTVLAAGHSASARYLRTFAMIHHEAALLPDGRKAVDGYLLTGHRVVPIPLRSGEAAYTDERRLVLVNAPVIRMQTESEVSPAPFAPSPSTVLVRQPDSEIFRMYEIAGTSHGDKEITDISFGPGSALARDLPGLVAIQCSAPPNPLAFSPYVRMALHHLNNWVNDGIAPPPGKLIDYTANPSPVGSSVRDGFGNAVGGIRPPHIDVPTGQHLPFNPPRPAASPFEVFFCSLNGAYNAFDGATLGTLYRNHGKYVSQFVEAVNQAVRDGYLLQEDAARMKAEAAASSVGHQ